MTDNSDGTKIWTMKMHVETGRNGTAILQVRRADEDKWYDTNSTVEIEIQGPLDMLTPKPEEITEPDPAEYDDDDYYDVDAEKAKEEGAEGEPDPEAESDENPNIEAEGVTGDLWGENGEEDPDLCVEIYYFKAENHEKNPFSNPVAGPIVAGSADGAGSAGS